MNGEKHPSSLPRIHAHLFTNSSSHCDWEGPHIPSAQVFTFPLVAEELQLPLFFLIQGIAVSDLNTENGVEEVSLAFRIPDAQASEFSHETHSRLVL